MPKWISTNKTNTETETQPLIAETKTRFRSNSKPYAVFYAFHSLTQVLFLLKDNFLFHISLSV